MKIWAVSGWMLLLGLFCGLAVPAVYAKPGGGQGGAKTYAAGQQRGAVAAGGGARQYAPGQRKKAAGIKGSARQYAPGQQMRDSVR